ncbi:MAG: D-alanine--D-alanine ligase [Ignavibacteriae bacterium HGW-Ignavibacteriae-1]|jgi:D-alanine-D-alanine ligase|nr:MAG: D-alanine--D-alanine ligase [Ignavibacteriae bacterium HGW-Ignavibacteriae-1]
MKIAVVYGGISTERNVAIAGGKAVIEALRSLNYEVVPVDPAYGADFLARSEEQIADIEKFHDIEDLKQFETRAYIDCIASDIFDTIDVVFIVLHGKFGEDGLIQSLLELRGIPYTGSKVKASALSSDKAASKMMLSAAGVLTPQWEMVHKSDIDNLDVYKDLRSSLGKELVVKPNDQGSTIGLTIIDNGNLDDIHNAIVLASKYSDPVMVEKYIEGRELTVGIIGGEVLPIIEIITHDGFYDYEHKYTKGKTEYICPADLTDDIAEFTATMATIVYNVLGCDGFARVDFRLDDEGQPWCLELNTIPGFTSKSLVPMAAKEIGIEFPELCEKIVNLALNKEKD